MHKFKFFLIANFLLVFGIFNSVALASDPPTPVPTPADTSFHAQMERFAQSAARIVPVFVEEFEKPFSPYLLTFAWLIAITCFLAMLFSHIFKNEGIGEDFVKWIVSSIFFFCLLAYSGDIDGNGKYGDLVDYFRTVGNSLAFGEIDQNGNILQNSFTQTKLTEQKTAFDQAYKDFTNKSFTVKVDSGQSALVMPSDSSIEERLFVKYSDGYNPQKIKDSLKPESWDMGSLFEWLNISRGIMEIADLFLLVLLGLLGSAMRLFFPIAVAVALHTELRGKTSMAFFWAIGVTTLVVPFFTQILRVAAYVAGNLAFASATPTTDYYSFEASNQAIIATGNPVYSIFLLCFLMCLTALAIFASPYLGFQVATGNIVNGLIGTVSGWFSGMASIGLNAVTSALAGSYSYMAKETQALRGYAQQAQLAADNRQIQYEQASGQYDQEVVGATASYNAANEQTSGQFNSSLINNAGNYQSTVAGIQTDTNAQFANLTNEANKAIEQQSIDYNKTQGQTENEWATNSIRNAPAIASFRRDQANETISSVPVGGQILNNIGVNGNLANVYDPLAQKVGLPTTRDGMQVENIPELPSNQGQSSQINSVADFLKQPNSKLPTQEGLNAPKSRDLPLIPAKPPVQPQIPSRQHSIPIPSRRNSMVTGGNGGLSQKEMTTASILNNEMMKLGYTPQARQVMLGEFGRENGFRSEVIANGHIDDKNGKPNVGIISWQGDRKDRLLKYMSKNGFVQKNGRLVNSEASLRAQVRFMDNELKNGGASFQRTHQMMKNPNVGQKDIADRMGGRNGYIGYNNTDPKYNNAGHPIYASPNSAKWANKAASLVKATSSVNQFKAPKFINGQGFVTNSGVSSANVVSSNTFNPKMNNGIASINQIPKMTDTMAKAAAPQMATNLSYANTSALNQYGRDANIGLTKQHSSNSINIAREAGEQRLNTASLKYDTDNYASQVSANSGYAANYMNYQGSMERAGIGYTTSTNVADMSYSRDMQAAQLQAEASIEAARLEAMSSFVQSMGSSVSHQLGEAFEKFNRF